MRDPGLLGAVIRQVISASAAGTKVLFITESSPSDDDRAVATDVARRAGLDEWSGWALVSTNGQPGLQATLDDLAATTSSPGALLVALDGSTVAAPERDDDLAVDVLELG